MGVFLVALVEPDNGAWIAIQTEWPDHHHFVSDQLALVAPEGVNTARDVRNIIGIRPTSGDPSGLVVELESGRFSGVLPKADVEWLQAVIRDE